MKRAEVWQDSTGAWLAGVDKDPLSTSHAEERDRRRIAERRYKVHPDEFPTHAEALAHALAEVGLAQPAEHREAP